MVKFIIVRHGYSKSNQDGKFCGQGNVPLSELGLKQAKEVSEYLENNFKIDAIYSSDLDRAYSTLIPLSESLGLTINKIESLREINVGLWQGLSTEEVKEKFPESFIQHNVNPWTHRFDGGETYPEVAERAIKAIDAISKNHEGQTIAIATHGGVVRALLAKFNNVPIEKAGNLPIVPNASICIVEYDKGRANVLTTGYCDYLSEKTTWFLSK